MPEGCRRTGFCVSWGNGENSNKGEKRCGITAESALFVCNKWDEVERQTNQAERDDLEKHIIDKLREKDPQT
ncbi:hypothetical protein OS493_040550 [Desmophyllum pertusum]|uniref:Uncharacterized protein n=1 Tax=Desmophyllum pertusum TaxID=174260 RepID=A0A9W9YTH6_9CNID|nr:hypothetical protein OS493_040550 [Desmophyllum pertusum]